LRMPSAVHEGFIRSLESTIKKELASLANQLIAKDETLQPRYDGYASLEVQRFSTRSQSWIAATKKPQENLLSFVTVQMPPSNIR
jgi:hypothetical protein